MNSTLPFTRSRSARRVRCSAGFTLIETMVTIGIAGVLSSVAYPSIEGQLMRARRSDALVGKAAVSEFAKGYFEAYQTVWVKTSVEFIVRDDWAYERYNYKSVDTPRPGGPAAGTPVVSDTGNGINIYQRGADGKWRVARDGWATDKALVAN